MLDYRSVSMGFGLEGINGDAQRQEVSRRTMSWLLDELDVQLAASLDGPSRKQATLTASAGGCLRTRSRLVSCWSANRDPSQRSMK